MAEARQRKHLSLRLELLEEQRDRLSSAVSHRVNKVIQLGKSWLAGKKEDKGKTLSYKEISDLIEDTDMLLAQQTEQLSDDDQVKTETSGDTLTSSSHSTATANRNAIDHHFLSADAEMLKSALARIQNLEESMASLQTNREQDAANIRRLQNKVRDLEKDKNKALKKVEKELQEVSFKYQMVCQIVADRLVPLEKLREILNNKVKNSHENVQKLYTVIQDVAELVPKVSHLEDQQQIITPAVAVTSYVHNITPRRSKIIERWVCNAGNTGGHFDVNTGMFTAPLDGHYGLALSVWQQNEGRIELSLQKTPSGGIPSGINDENLYWGMTNKHESGDSGFFFANLKAGDKLYICVQNAEKNPTLADCTFSIFLLK